MGHHKKTPKKSLKCLNFVAVPQEEATLDWGAENKQQYTYLFNYLVQHTLIWTDHIQMLFLETGNIALNKN